MAAQPLPHLARERFYVLSGRLFVPLCHATCTRVHCVVRPALHQYKTRHPANIDVLFIEENAC